MSLFRKLLFLAGADPARDKNTPYSNDPGFSPSPATLRGPVSPKFHTPGYMYHATNLDNLREIRESGLKTFKPWQGNIPEQKTWSDGKRDSRAYFTENPTHTYKFSPYEGEPVLLRTKKRPDVRHERYTGDLFSRTPFKPDELEYWTEKGDWAPVKIHPGPRTGNGITTTNNPTYPGTTI